MLPALIGGIAQGVSGLISGIAGIAQKREGNRLLKRAGEETVPQELLANQIQAQSMANEGLPSQQYNNAMKNIQRQQLLALRGANDRRGGLATVSTTQQLASDALQKLDVSDAQARRENQRFAMGVNNQVGNFKHNIWERKYNYAQGLRGYGNQNIIGGLDKLTAAGGSLAYGGLYGGGGRTKAAPGYSMTEEDFQRD
jgi:hypothetical protein